MSNYPQWSPGRFAFLAASIVTLWMLWAQWAWVKAPKVSPAVSQAALQTEFAHYNDGYFGGNLPRDTQVVYGPAPDPGVMGETLCDVYGDEPTRCVIYIVPKDNPVRPTAMATLIHETCHIATAGKDFDHGPIWQKCMLDVASEGGFEGVW